MKFSRFFLAWLLCFILSALANAEELPLWEAGLGLTGLSMPDYRGSNEQRDYLFPLPYEGRPNSGDDTKSNISP